MPAPAQQQQQQRQAPGKGFPADFQLFPLEGARDHGGIGLNTKAKRPAIEDQDAAWIENYLAIGVANSRALYGSDEPVYSGATIINFCPYNIGSVAYVAVFKDDGSAVQVRISDGATTTIGAAGTFWSAGNVATPTIVQWAASGILIVSKRAADAYWAWDGTLYSPGDPTSPVWLNGDTPTPMPLGVAGTDIEIFLSRVWIVDGTNILTSVASNGADFSTANGGLTKPNQESTLRRAYTAIRQVNGYLYVFGDSSVAYITNVQTSTTAVTTYQFTVIEPQIGTAWRDSVAAFGRSILFANVNGVYAIYGSSANKISDMLDGIWDSTKADFAAVEPSAAVATLYGIRVFMVTLRTIDPTTRETRTLLCLYDGKKWTIGSQDPAPVLVAPQILDSELTAYGSDGTDVRSLFTVPSSTLEKRLVSKLWGGEYGFVMQKQVLRFYTQVEALNDAAANLQAVIDTDNGRQWPVTEESTQTLTFVNSLGETLQFQNSAFADLYFQSKAAIQMVNAEGSGLLLGFTLTSTSPDYVLERAAIGYKNLTALY